MEQNQINLSKLTEMLEEMAERNWAVSLDVFSQDLCRALAHECQKLADEGALSKASIGHGHTKTVHAEIRGDFTRWLDQHPFLENLETLRRELNQFFFLGLKRVEAHFAFYPPGAGYDKHIDNHYPSYSDSVGVLTANHRKVTFVLYLNENWQKSDGGELSLYNPDNEEELLAQVQPRLGTLILFRSELFPHQVEKSFANRLSLTGWFRDDAL